MAIAARLRTEFDLLDLTYSAASLDGFVEQGREGLAGHVADRYSGELRALEKEGLAEFERYLILSRTAEGRQRAKARGSHMTISRLAGVTFMQ